ncbi:MAG: DNA-directed DNA polymerase II small subunit [Nitrososphaerales archaeon]|nr:DNA-directed DNA polymerase II small subunit [Nitrososphaerales archaeon]
MSQSKAVSKALASGFMFDSKAFDLISKLPPEFDVDGLVDVLLQRKSDVVGGESKRITAEDVVELLPSDVPTMDQEARLAAPLDESVDMEMISDPTMGIAPAEAFEGFARLFRDRYDRLLSVVKRRPDTRNVGTTAAGRALVQGQKAKVVGLISHKVNRRNVVELTLDDPTGTLRAVCQDEAVAKAAREAPLDSMVVLEVSRSRSGQLYANSLTLPDVPDRRMSGQGHRVYAVLLSDLHVGSKMFLADDFRRFIQWINGKLGDLDVVSRIRYVVVAGDLVDGVGVYPGQELQLAERDPKNQYEAAAKLLEQVPSQIQIVVSPGNHDAVRQALPQPAVPADFAESLYRMENVRWVGDPAYVKLHGVTFLIYHGKSLDDVIATTPELAYGKPTDAMKLLLRSRHLAPTYGKRTALSPELRDFMVVDPVPDVLHCGHVHAFGELNYRGTLLVNSGTWQSQTSFQANMGLEPTPSIIPVVNLSDLSVTRRNFGSAGFPAA